MSVIELVKESEIRIYTGEVSHGDCEVYEGDKSEKAIAARLKKERKGGARWARAVAVVGSDGIDVETGEKIALVECTGDDLKRAYSLVASYRGKASKGKPKTRRTKIYDL